MTGGWFQTGILASEVVTLNSCGAQLSAALSRAWVSAATGTIVVSGRAAFTVTPRLLLAQTQIGVAPGWNPVDDEQDAAFFDAAADANCSSCHARRGFLEVGYTKR